MIALEKAMKEAMIPAGSAREVTALLHIFLWLSIVKRKFKLNILKMKF